MKKNDEIQLFLSLSSELTGFSKIDLQGTDSAEQFISKLKNVIGKTHFNTLLKAWDKIKDSSDLEYQIKSKLLGDDLFGPVARNLIKIWYVGTWKQLPKVWYTKYKNNEIDPKNGLEHVVSPHAYKEGLIWDAIGTHPPGAKPPGFGSWSNPPK